MNVKLSRWGNSLAVRIPSGLAAEAAIEEGSALDLQFKDGVLRLVPVREKPSIESLVAGITENNRHGEIETGEPMGNESW